MLKRFVGKTNIAVSVLGLGTVKFGRNQGVHYPEAFNLPTDAELLSLLQQAKSLGVNLIDTAPAYGESEERLGRLLQKDRHQWVICSKAGEEFNQGQSSFDFSADSLRASVERSLKRLHTDYLDILLIHSNGADERIIKKDEVFVTLQTLKNEGKIRAFGMSTKTIAGGLLAVDHADVVMVTYNPVEADDRLVISYAAKKQKGIFIKKSLVSGHLDKIAHADPITETMRFIFAEKGVTSIILGTINPLHLQQNISSALAVLS